MWFVFDYFKGYKWTLVLTLFLASINQIFSLLDPQIFRLIIDNYVTIFDQYTVYEFVRGVGFLLLLSVVVAMVSRVAKNFQDYFVNVMTQNIGMNIYQKSIRHAFDLPYKILEDEQSGRLLDKLNKARISIQAFISSLISNVFVSVVGLLFVIVYALSVHWIIAVFYAGLLPLTGIIIYKLSGRLKKAQADIVRETAELSGSTTETIRNVALVKSLGLENQEMDRLEKFNIKILWLELKKIKTIRLIDFSQGTIINFLRICLMATMFWLVYLQSISLGEFFSLYFYSFYIFSPLYLMGDVLKYYQEAKASHEILQDLLSKEIDVDIDGQVFSDLKSIKFDNVNFSYNGNKTVLDDVSFNVKSGTTVAFVGPSGSGKSTITKLILGLYYPNSGDVLINDINIKDIDRRKFSNMVGLVSQDTQLFSGTIRENLLFSAPLVDDDMMMDIIKKVKLDDLGDGHNMLDLLIGEGGLKLSGGQKQRLAIARALLREPKLLIFDEATSSLDSIVEKSIGDTIVEVTKNKDDIISVLIAHRLSTVIHADVIYVLEKGKIVESGNHEKLLNIKGLYYALWRQQIGAEE